MLGKPWCAVRLEDGELTRPSEKPPAPTTTTPPFSTLTTTIADDIFGSALGAPPTSTSHPATATKPPPSAAFDDLDDDFEGLEDAKEGSADDDFATISRSGLDDFNPVFDSSPPPSQPKSDAAVPGGGAAVFGTESSFDFGSLSGASVAGSTTGQPTTAKGQAAADAQDWDALFAGLDAATPTGTGSSGGAPLGNTTGNGTAGAGERPPAPGRALTEEGEHDDPILKNLTGMGYARGEALVALEKYDYNLERVSYY